MSDAKLSVVVTGAGRGIGRACAVEVGKRGGGVVVVSRTAGELEETARLVREAGGRAEVVVGDASDERVVAAAVARAVERFGGVTGVVSAAGVAPLRPVMETSVALLREVLEVNLVSAFVLARSAWGELKKSAAAGRHAGVVTISSYASRDPFVGFSAYAAAKGGVNAMTLALDKEGKGDGVRAYAVAPAAVETAMFRALVPAEQWPSEKTLRPEDVAAVVMQCLCGALTHSGGETIFLSKT